MHENEIPQLLTLTHCFCNRGPQMLAGLNTKKGGNNFLLFVRRQGLEPWTH